MKLLDPLYKKGLNPIILKEKDYLWVHKALGGKKDEVIYWKTVPVYLDTIQTKKKTAKLACRYCSKTDGRIKFYIIADNMEEPKPYHFECMQKFKMDVLQQLSGKKLKKYNRNKRK